jgi:hypothetical protein
MKKGLFHRPESVPGAPATWQDDSFLKNVRQFDASQRQKHAIFHDFSAVMEGQIFTKEKRKLGGFGQCRDRDVILIQPQKHD